MGSVLMGSLQMLCITTRDTDYDACILLLVTFAAAPLVLTPFVRNRGLLRARGPGRGEPDLRVLSTYNNNHHNNNDNNNDNSDDNNKCIHMANII